MAGLYVFPFCFHKLVFVSRIMKYGDFHTFEFSFSLSSYCSDTRRADEKSPPKLKTKDKDHPVS